MGWKEREGQDGGRPTADGSRQATYLGDGAGAPAEDDRHDDEQDRDGVHGIHRSIVPQVARARPWEPGVRWSTRSSHATLHQADAVLYGGLVPVPFTPFVDLVLHASVKVTPTSATVVSTELAGAAAFGGPASHNEPGTQAIAIPCTVGVGDTLALSDADYAFATHVDSTNGPDRKSVV